MKRAILIIWLILAFSPVALADEKDASVQQQVQDAMGHARHNSNRGPSSADDWFRVADSAAKLLSPISKSQKSGKTQESDGDLMDIIGDFFK